MKKLVVVALAAVLLVGGFAVVKSQSQQVAAPVAPSYDPGDGGRT